MKKKYKTFIVLPLLLLVAVSIIGVMNFCGFKEKTNVHSFTIESDKSSSNLGYVLSKADKDYLLPPVLNEISGITDINVKEIGCVQDEKGTIFIYDLQKKAITKQISIAPEGDFEGITIVKDTMYMLRSDGKLLEIKNYLAKNYTVVSHNLELRSTNNEGLCYDERNARLLIASKGKIGKGAEFKDIRVINVFDLKTKKINPDLIIEFSVNDIEAFAAQRKIKLPVKSRKKGKGVVSALKFMPSAIAVHPFTDNIYLLSAIDRMFLVLDKKGKVVHVESLSRSLFSKPEGITFLKNGDMLISNEGKNGKPSLLKFSFSN